MIRPLRSLSERVPLRVTLVATLLLLVTVALGATGTVSTYMLRGYLTERVDAQLVDLARIVEDALLRQGVEAVKNDATLQLATANSSYVQIALPNGDFESILATPLGSAQQAPRLPRVDRAAAEDLAGKPFTRGAQQGRGYSWRVLVYPLPGEIGALVVAISLDEVEHTVAQFTVTQMAVGALLLAVLAIVGYAMVRSNLRRLGEVERTARAIAAGDLTQRVPPGHPETEVGRLAGAFNAMLAEIEAAFRAREYSEQAARGSEARMRRFVADASHELRTPLTAIRGFAELYRQGGGDAGQLLGRIEHHAARMGSLVEDLLLLARLDQQRPLEQRPVDLLALAAEAVQDAAATSGEHPVELRAVADHPPIVLGDELRLRQVIGNLLSNAVTHTPAGTPVTVTVDTREGAAVLTVADAGAGLAAEDAARVFERFFRTDPARARSRAEGGSGLGLSIVHALVAAHGGQVWLETTPGAGARFEVRLPLYEPDGVRPEIGTTVANAAMMVKATMVDAAATPAGTPDRPEDT